MRSSESGDSGNSGTGAAAAIVTDSHSCVLSDVGQILHSGHGQGPGNCLPSTSV